MLAWNALRVPKNVLRCFQRRRYNTNLGHFKRAGLDSQHKQRHLSLENELKVGLGSQNIAHFRNEYPSF
jgi:hypothetical protein